MSDPEQLDFFPLPPQPTVEEIRHEVSTAIMAGVELHPVVIEEKPASEATVDQGHAGPQLIPGTPIAKVMKRKEATQYYQDEFGLSGAPEFTDEELAVRKAGFARVRAVIEEREVRKRTAEYAAEVRKAMAKPDEKQ